VSCSTSAAPVSAEDRRGSPPRTAFGANASYSSGICTSDPSNSTVPKDEARSKTALEFFKWALEKGQAQAKALDYVALPDALVKQIEAYWASTIK